VISFSPASETFLPHKLPTRVIISASMPLTNPHMLYVSMIPHAIIAVPLGGWSWG